MYEKSLRSGKSTLLRCLNQLETATSGKIIIDGHDVTDKHTDINKVRENIGYGIPAFQSVQSSDRTGQHAGTVHLKLMNKEEAKNRGTRLLNV